MNTSEHESFRTPQKAVVMPHPYEAHSFVNILGVEAETDCCHHCHAPENMVSHLPNIRLSDGDYKVDNK